MLNQIEPQRANGSDPECLVASAAEKGTCGRLVFREVNERIVELTTLLDGLGIHLLICECSNDGCAESIEITPAGYDAVLAHPNRFLVVAGHQLPETDQVVGGNGRYLVVETSAC